MSSGNIRALCSMCGTAGIPQKRRSSTFQLKTETAVLLLTISSILLKNDDPIACTNADGEFYSLK
jgi:hypothetical protein